MELQLVLPVLSKWPFAILQQLRVGFDRFQPKRVKLLLKREMLIAACIVLDRVGTLFDL